MRFFVGVNTHARAYFTCSLTMLSQDNEYTIENDYDRPARIFFAQGQEVAVNPPPEQETAEDEQDADEEVEVSEEEEEGSEGE